MVCLTKDLECIFDDYSRGNTEINGIHRAKCLDKAVKMNVSNTNTFTTEEKDLIQQLYPKVGDAVAFFMPGHSPKKVGEFTCTIHS